MISLVSAFGNRLEIESNASFESMFVKENMNMRRRVGGSPIIVIRERIRVSRLVYGSFHWRRGNC